MFTIGFPDNLRILRNTTFFVDGEAAKVRLGSNSFHHYNAYLLVSGLESKDSLLVEAPEIGFSATLVKTKPLPPSRLAVQTIYKEDEELLPLGIAYHHKIGFDAFFLYNNYGEATNISVQLTKLIQTMLPCHALKI